MFGLPTMMPNAKYNRYVNYIEGFDNGADAYITKPFSAQLLTSRIENLLKNRHMLRSLFGKDEVPEDVFKPRESEFVHRFREYIRQNLGNSDLNIAGLTAKSLKMNVQGNASVDLAHLTVDRTNVDVLGNASMDLMFDLGGDVNLDIQGNGSATLTGVTRNQPVYKMQGNGSVNDRTTRAQK